MDGDYAEFKLLISSRVTFRGACTTFDGHYRLRNEARSRVRSNPAWYMPQQHQDDHEGMSAAQSEYEKHSLTMRMALKQPSFWSLWLNNFLFSLVHAHVGCRLVAEWKQLDPTLIKMPPGIKKLVKCCQVRRYVCPTQT